MLAGNNPNGTSSYGGAGDSVVISLSAIKIANIKMIENEYNKVLIADYQKLIEQYENKIKLQDELIVDLKLINQNVNSNLEEVEKQNRINKILLRVFEGTTIIFGVLSIILSAK